MILLLKVLVMYYVLLCETLIRCSQPTINSVICRVNVAYYQVYCEGKTLTLMSSHSLTITIVHVVQVVATELLIPSEHCLSCFGTSRKPVLQ